MRGRAAGHPRSDPQPRHTGRVARGRQMAQGTFLLGGYVIEAPGSSIWALPVDEDASTVDLHGFDWLADLVAAGTPEAEACARDWTFDWLDRFGRGRGPGWSPALTGRRVRNMLDFSAAILGGAGPGDADRLFAAAGRQARHVARRWARVPIGMARFDALGGAVIAALTLEGLSDELPALTASLGLEAARRIDAEAGLATRNPEHLLELFALLVRVRSDLIELGHEVPTPLDEAIRDAAALLRALRHADGGLARFHGGGRGAPGLLDRALALSGARPRAAPALPMGFARLSRGRTTLIMDAAPPPEGPGSVDGHASTLAFELTSGRRPVVVNCGAGRHFGAKWRRAGRATPSHSTLVLDGYSSARIASADDTVSEAPADVRLERRESDRASGLIAGHDGYVLSHGLTHVRQVYLSHDGRGLQGEDVIATLDRHDEAIFDRALAAAGGEIPFSVRFHLHPNVFAETSEDGTAISLMLKSGELWVFRHTGAAGLSVEASVYLDMNETGPVPSRQIVLSSRAVEYATRVSWTLAKARQTPDAVRDDHDDGEPVLA
ncbi:heparinase [Palleronia sediminis]|uniref:Heparinase n=2 Tax=Palleronia sediminis TaxID=2547833 RepID=A0A4R6A4N3_9RHOB|nr:heparinase [Palleronia sediminis]